MVWSQLPLAMTKTMNSGRRILALVRRHGLQMDSQYGMIQSLSILATMLSNGLQVQERSICRKPVELPEQESRELTATGFHAMETQKSSPSQLNPTQTLYQA
jgi:hypothetical protein